MICDASGVTLYYASALWNPDPSPITGNTDYEGQCTPIFDNATRQAQHMIISGLVERVEVGTGYDIQVKLRISAKRFFEPNKEPETMDKVS